MIKITKTHYIQNNNLEDTRSDSSKLYNNESYKIEIPAAEYLTLFDWINSNLQAAKGYIDLAEQNAKDASKWFDEAKVNVNRWVDEVKVETLALAMSLAGAPKLADGAAIEKNYSCDEAKIITDHDTSTDTMSIVG
ncbi:hypothetical protein [Wolbachia endosymbiont of Chironomus riparius]|uniref:hypothetical protein n=1 Tax=Wolbachia endosymbiont of Chironomus riparius TaxID=2883238 RepID=UPI00209E733F|nr:hypothetical protein [Wolbachia endosymbiont of Chironomus riparius]